MPTAEGRRPTEDPDFRARTAAPENTRAPFSELLKRATRSAHEDAEQHGFTRALLAGRLPREGYAAMIAQHYFAYLALERVGRSLAGDPVAGAVVDPGLFRVPALERDLGAVYGGNWRERIAPTAATRAYTARIEQTSDDPAGYVAHHYTRYLGDLSGGQFIRKAAAGAYGLDEQGGTSFYDFSALGSLPRFKAGYRARLDALQLNGAERDHVVRETRLAYRLNVAVLADLGHTFAAETAA
ncbi:biliverdin-producing heme oxygenase [Streptomonospora wellingtoniae]|uniref:Biliverdin-producing heme oxygenase n=1 Tax=Streptomonospora wellingtoniae TaxID=3075544 RepID=A0ABU2KSF4_9ACTN|nr:biliverdin-producing heme oxygenase [Streptomonospora sp. DSM 45055]MDT0302215.1 biliverdin-producing heme oxygenase [Streptomonospora sp. DSM 45055]